MKNRYENIVYSNENKEMLNKTKLTNEEIEKIQELKIKFQNNNFYPVIEDLYKFQKNNYSTASLADLFNVSIRQIQNIFKYLEINRNRSEAQQANLYKSNSILDIKVPSASKIKDFKITVNLPDRLEEFLNYLSVIRGRSKNTIDGYKVDLIMLFKFLMIHKKLYPQNTSLEEIIISDIDDDFIRSIKLSDLYAFLAFLEKSRSNSAYARARKVASIKSFFKYLNTKTRILNENPASDLETPKINKRNPIYLTLDESKELLSSIDESYKYQIRDFCIITLFLNCGLRLSELCSINISKIKDDILTVIGKGNKERTVYLNNACLKAISQYLIERRNMEILPEYKDALFISSKKRRINKKSVEVIVTKYIKAAGLINEKYTPHKLRHTAATLMYKYGNVDIRSLQQILGHENVSTTQIYTHVDDEKLREAVNLNPLNVSE